MKGRRCSVPEWEFRTVSSRLLLPSFFTIQGQRGYPNLVIVAKHDKGVSSVRHDGLRGVSILGVHLGGKIARMNFGLPNLLT